MMIFSDMDQKVYRGAVYHLYKAGKTAKQIHSELVSTHDGDAPMRSFYSYSMVNE